MSILTPGSVVIIKSGESFIVMNTINGYTIAQVDAGGIEHKPGVVFPSLNELECWFNQCESKILKVIPFSSFISRIPRIANLELTRHQRYK